MEDRELDQGDAIRAFEILKAYPRDAVDWDKVLPLVNRIALAGLPDFWAKTEIVTGAQTRTQMDEHGRLAVASAARLEVWNVRQGTPASHATGPGCAPPRPDVK